MSNRRRRRLDVIRSSTLVHSMERIATGSERPYATVLPGRAIDPTMATTLSQHVKLGAGVGSTSAALAVCWLFAVGLFTAEEMNGAGLIVLVIPIAAICGALVGVAAAVLLGALLWPTLALSLAKYAYPVTAGALQGAIMSAYGRDAFDVSIAAGIVGIGAIAIAVVIASRWTAAMLVQLSRSTAPGRTETS